MSELQEFLDALQREIGRAGGPQGRHVDWVPGLRRAIQMAEQRLGLYDQRKDQ